MIAERDAAGSSPGQRHALKPTVDLEYGSLWTVVDLVEPAGVIRPPGKFRGHHTHLSCFFQGTELRDSVRFGERSPRLDGVGVSVILTPPAPLVANAKPLERSKSGGDKGHH